MIVITSYSIHYTKLYELHCGNSDAEWRVALERVTSELRLGTHVALAERGRCPYRAAPAKSDRIENERGVITSDSIHYTKLYELHCDIPGTDASGVVKSMMDELIDEFKNWNMPNRVHLTTSCCQINCGGQGDIAINVQHTKPPKINHDLVSNVCERPSVVARCPVAAIRPALVNGKPSLEGDEKKCICCRNNFV